MRITRPQMFMDIAHTVARRSTCMRLNVGAVLVKGRSIVSIGYNGVRAGEPHCAGNDCPGKSGCLLTVHAEENALLHLPPGTQGPLDLYVTDSPCQDCYQTIMRDTRVTRIFFGTPYRNSTHLDTIPEWPAPQVYRLTPAGYLMDWRTKLLTEVLT